ncbi:hypothetical protein RchiOBHm_Chr6g0282741 [Rosa chinensis]|uniref:Uncharacterized protein n=1 Tax=Rosa chinensis TaxID=74649 RepID=A0A2P6PTU9_ROSCH|nr:hypothetical protein RchiOBHm_Chr6g0282741 [Rosa chinensis]
MGYVSRRKMEGYLYPLNKQLEKGFEEFLQRSLDFQQQHEINVVFYLDFH